MDAEQPETTGKTVMFVKPLAVTVEVTPEMVQQLKQSMATIPRQMRKPPLYSRG
jgi:hypothetical protein